MIVRCTRIIDDTGRPSADHPSVSVGKEYVVLAMEAIPGRGMFLRVLENIAVDRGHALYAILWPAAMFEVVSSRVSARWCVKITIIGGGGHVEIAPDTWLRDGFWDDVIEDSPMSEAAREEYQQEIIALLSEEQG
jgi:hypothetical protein